MLNRLTSLGVIIFSISSFALFSENNSNIKADLSTPPPAEKSISVKVENPVPSCTGFP